ncbi:MAG: peptidase C39 family protein [Candidatus Pacearchaeota archaeon]
MILGIPFYKQDKEVNCGPISLQMVLNYFEGGFGLEEVEKACEIKEGKGVFTVQLAFAAASLGYKVEFYSKQIGVNKEHLKKEFYQRYAEDLEKAEEFEKRAREFGAKVEERHLGLSEILSYLDAGKVPIALLDWNVVKGSREKGYRGHFVPVVGYDEENVYVHNGGFDSPQEFMSISKEVFDEARKVDGTGEDVVFVWK